MDAAKHSAKTLSAPERLPSVATVIPTWNSMSDGKSVERTIRSLISQGVDIELLVVDNWSQDSTRNVCHSLGAQVIQRKTTRSEARNLGLEKASGEFVLFLDSDHELERGALAEALRLAEKDKLDAVFMKTTYLQVGSDKSLSVSPIELELRLRPGVRFPNLFRRSAISGTRFPPDLDLGEDYVFMREFIEGGAKIGTMNWGLRHYSAAGLASVWKRSTTYGRAYRRNHRLPERRRFLSGLAGWNPKATRAYLAMWRSSPRDACALAQFLLVKYVGFVFGLLSTEPEAAAPLKG